MRNIKCLDCKYVEITENSGKGFIGESLIDCKICNEINGEMENCEDYKEKIERCKRINIKPIDDASQLIYVSSANEKYTEFVKEIRKHPYKLYEYHTGEKLPLWKRIYIDLLGRIKKTEHEKKWIAINKAIKPYIRKR